MGCRVTATRRAAPRDRPAARGFPALGPSQQHGGRPGARGTARRSRPLSVYAPRTARQPPAGACERRRSWASPPCAAHLPGMQHGNGPLPEDAQGRAWAALHAQCHKTRRRPRCLRRPPHSHLSELQETASGPGQLRLCHAEYPRCPHLQGTALLSPDFSPKGAALQCSPMATLPQSSPSRAAPAEHCGGTCGTGGTASPGVSSALRGCSSVSTLSAPEAL